MGSRALPRSATALGGMAMALASACIEPNPEFRGDDEQATSTTSEAETQSDDSTSSADASSGADGTGGASSDTGTDGSGSASEGSDVSLPCVDVELGSELGVVYVGSTLGTGNDWYSECGTDIGADLAFAWLAPSAGTYRIRTTTPPQSQFDAVLAIYDGCEGPLRTCNDDAGEPWNAALAVTADQDEVVLIVVDSWAAQEGEFELVIESI